MERHNYNAKIVAEFLENSSKVEVIYQGLVSHEQHSLAKEQMKGYGEIVSVAKS